MKKALAAKGNFYMMLTAIVFTVALGEFGPGMNFMTSNPAILKDVILFSVCSAVGQAFIFFTISSFDPLVCTTVTTTRKVFSVLLSILTKGHQLNAQGWTGIAMACSGILGELGAKVMASGPKSEAKDKKKT